MVGFGVGFAVGSSVGSAVISGVVIACVSGVLPGVMSTLAGVHAETIDSKTARERIIPMIFLNFPFISSPLQSAEAYAFRYHFKLIRLKDTVSKFNEDAYITHNIE